MPYLVYERPLCTSYARAMATGTPTEFDALEAALEFARAWTDELGTFVATPTGDIIDPGTL